MPNNINALDVLFSTSINKIQIKLSKTNREYLLITNKEKFSPIEEIKGIHQYGTIIFPTEKGFVIKEIYCDIIRNKKLNKMICSYKIRRNIQIRKVKSGKFQQIIFTRNHYQNIRREKVRSAYIKYEDIPKIFNFFRDKEITTLGRSFISKIMKSKNGR